MAIVGATMQIAFWTLVLPAVMTLLPKLLGNFFYAIGALFFTLLDMLQNIFRKLAGLGTVYVDDGEVNDIVTYVLKSDIIVEVLVSVAVFALGLVILGSIVQMIRLEYTTEGSKNSKEQVFGKALKSLLMFVLIPIVCLVGIRLSNYLLQAVDYATAPNGSSTVSGSIFSASGSDASKIADEDNRQASVDITDLIGTITKSKDWSNATVDTKTVPGKMIIQHFGEKFASVAYTSGNDDACRQKLAKRVAEKFTMSATDDEGTIKVGVTLGSSGAESSAWDNTKLTENTKLSYLNINAVSYFYNTGNFNYVMMYLACFLCLKALLSASLGMISRIYKLAAYFVISPAVIGLQPLDNGSAYTNWKKEFISNVLSCYGFIVALNLYFSIVSVLQTIELWQGAWAFGLNYFVQLLFVVTGATMINDLATKLGTFIGGGNAMSDGEGAMSKVGEQMGKIGKVGMAGINIAAGGIASKIGGIGTGGTAKRDKSRQAKVKAEEKGWEHKDGKYIGKDGKELSGSELKEAQKTFKAVENKNFAKYDDKYEKASDEEKEKMDKKEARNRNRYMYAKTKGNQLMNRGTSAIGDTIKDSGIMKSFRSISGDMGKYITGEAFKSADEKFAKKWGKQTGIDAESVVGKSGTSAIYGTAQKVADMVSDKAHPMVKGKVATMTQGQSNAAQKKADGKEIGEIVKEKNANYDAIEKEITGKQQAINEEANKMKHAHNGIDTNMLAGATSGYKEYSPEAMSALNNFMNSAKHYANGNMSGDGFRQSLNDVYNGGNIDKNGKLKEFAGNKFVEELLKSITDKVTGAGDEDYLRGVVGNINGLNVNADQLKANVHDSANDTKTYGTYNERQDFKDMNSAFAGLEKAKEANNEARKDLNTAHQKFKDDNTGAYGVEHFMKDINPGDERAEEANKKLAKDIANALKNTTLKTALGGDAGKMKVDFTPISKILQDIKQKQEQEAQKAKDAEASTAKTNELLSELIKKTKSS